MPRKRKKSETMDVRTCTRHAVTLILTIGVAFTVFFLGTARADLVDRVLVVVNDEVILLSDLDQVMSTMRVAYERRGVSSLEQQRLLDEQRPIVLEKMIRDKLTDQQVARHKVKVDDEDVDATILRIRKANKLTEEEFKRAVELEGVTYEIYRKEIKDNLLRSRLLNREVRSKIVITDSDIKKYYDAHIDQYTGSTKYKLRHILLRLAPGASDAQRERVAEETNVIRRRLQDGEPFEKLARQFSDAPTASNGGRLGVFGTNLLTDDLFALVVILFLLVVILDSLVTAPLRQLARRLGA